MNIVIQFGFPMIHGTEDGKAETQAMISIFKMISSREFYGQYANYKHS